MTNFKCGQIWLVNFDPSFGHEYQKFRPAIIIENNNYISVGNLITLIPISSKITKINLLDILVKKDSKNRLLSDSLIKTFQISSFDKRRFIKLIGVANSEILIKIKTNLDYFLLS